MKTSLAGIAIVLVTTAAAHATQYVVLEARAIALPRGTIIDSSKPLVLKKGQHVTLISDSGARLQLDGPYRTNPSAKGEQGVDLAATLQGLITASKPRVGDVATMRAPGLEATLPNPWLIDASRGGDRCLLEGQAPVFWRPEAANTIAFSIRPADRTWKVEALWPANLDRLPFNSAFVRGDENYVISYNGTESAITMHTVPASLVNDNMRAGWMAAEGCEAQAEALVEARR